MIDLRVIFEHFIYIEIFSKSLFPIGFLGLIPGSVPLGLHQGVRVKVVISMHAIMRHHI